jgi:hypothetical protein
VRQRAVGAAAAGPRLFVVVIVINRETLTTTNLSDSPTRNAIIFLP